MKIALFGGTFNPIHLGHLRIAEEARESLGLERVIFMPACVPPHKAEPSLVSPEVRLEMVRTAIGDNPFFEASDLEISRGGRSFTIDTVRELLSGGRFKRVSLIIGSDSFNDIASWYEYRALLELASFIVVTRPGYAMKKPGEALPVELARKFWYDPATDSYVNSGGNSITYLCTTFLGISSSYIRERVSAGGSIKYLVPESVERFIFSRRLYSPGGEKGEAQTGS